MTTQEQINDKIFELIELYIAAKIPMTRMNVDYYGLDGLVFTIDFFRYGELVIRDPVFRDKVKLERIKDVFQRGGLE